MKKLILLVAVLFLTACEPSTSEQTGKYKLPKALEDCSIFELGSGDGALITAMRCPNSTTSATTQGKRKKRVVVVDGITYEESESKGE